MIRATSRAMLACSRLAHRLLHIMTGLVVVTALLLAGAAWRLSRGPIQVGWLADRTNAILADDSAPVRARFKSAALTWEGFHAGVDYPLDLRLNGIVLTDPMNRTIAEAPDAHVTFSLASLLLGRVIPRTVEVDHARIALTRAADGAIGPNGGEAEDGRPAAGPQDMDIGAFRSQLMRPAGSDRRGGPGLLEQLSRVHFRDASVSLVDQASGLRAEAAGLNLDLRRVRAGRIDGSLEAPVVIGGQTVAVSANLAVAPGADMVVKATVGAFRPAAMQGLSPALAGIDVPVSASVAVTFGRDFRLRDSSVDLHLGAGSVALGQGRFPLRHGDVSLAGTPARIAITGARVDVARADDAPPTAVTADGEILRSADRIVASLTVGVSQLDLADLSRLWPPGVGGGARGWIVENVLGGVVPVASGTFVVESDGSLNDVVLTKAAASVDATGAAFTWIGDVPPVQQAEVHLRLLDPDTAEIEIPAARQRVRGGGGDLLIRDGRMRITGLSQKDQFTTIRTVATGPLTSVMALLKLPRLHLLSAHPIGLKPTAGDTSAVLDFQFPLESELQMDDVAIHAEARVRSGRLPDAVAGRGLEDAALDLTADKNGMTGKGRGVLAGIPVGLSGTMDFTPGPPDQSVRKIDVTAEASSAQLDAAGLRVSDVANGSFALKAGFIERRNGSNTIGLSGDLTGATLSVAPLAWLKPSGTPATASAVVLLTHDRMAKIDRIAVHGDGLDVAASVDFTNGEARSVRFDTLRLGRTEAHGTATLGQGVAVELRGGQIDLAPKLAEKSNPDGPPPPLVTKPPWTLDARFDRALMANDEQATGFVATARGDGETIRMLDAAAAFGPSTGFTVRIEPSPVRRHLHVESTDAGRFFSAMGTTRRMEQGHLVIDGNFETPQGYHPLSGTMEATNVLVRNSPVLGKLLQAITLYGLVDALRGPGMIFSHIVAPFRYEGDKIFFNQARAFNPSLGVTARGSIALANSRAAINGTIVPAYFFNTLLGRLPVVGRLFSPEVGGGVFAVRYRLEGPTDDPAISINPISGLTPGFLREIFGIFGKDEPARQP